MNRGGGAACIRDVNLGEEMLRRANKLISGDSCWVVQNTSLYSFLLKRDIIYYLILDSISFILRL